MNKEEFMLKMQQEFAGGENAKNRDLQWRIANLKADSTAASGSHQAGRPVPPTQMEKIQTLDTSLTEMRGVYSRFKNDPKLQKEIGPVEGIDIIKSWTNPEFGDFKAQVGRMFDSYRQAITGAGASAQELKMLQANMPTVKDPPPLFMKKLETLDKMATAVRNRRVSNLKRARFDVGDLEANDAVDAATTGAPAAPQGVYKTIKLKDGTVKKGWLLPDGNFQPE